MKSVTQLKSLADVRTTISTHARSTPRLKGSTYLEVYLLDKEKQRLETEHAMLTKRQKRIEARLAEIREAAQALIDNAQSAPTQAPSLEDVPADGSVGANGRSGHAWRQLPVDY